MRGLFAILLATFLLAGCEQSMKQLGPTEYAIRFRVLPRILGGGIAKKVESPGEMVVVFPWDKLYIFDTSVRDISWAIPPAGQSAHADEAVYTRAIDGNEVALAVTIRYKITSDPEKLRSLVQEVATTNDEVRNIVTAIARADIRTYMNQLKTSEFLEKEPRYVAVDKVRDALGSQLEKYGIEIQRVNLDDFRFERLLRDGTVDASYQEKLNDIQRYVEDTEREKSRVNTVKAKKSQEFNEAQAEVNRQVQEAMGYLTQAKSRGDAYLEARKNDAQAVLAKGQAEVEGLTEQVKALSGPGGQALLRLQIAQELLKNDPKFVLMSPAEAGSGLSVNRLDTNQLLSQMGVMEGMGVGVQAKPKAETLPSGQSQ